MSKIVHDLDTKDAAQQATMTQHVRVAGWLSFGNKNCLLPSWRHLHTLNLNAHPLPSFSLHLSLQPLSTNSTNLSHPTHATSAYLNRQLADAYPGHRLKPELLSAMLVPYHYRNKYSIT